MKTFKVTANPAIAKKMQKLEDSVHISALAKKESMKGANYSVYSTSLMYKDSPLMVNYLINNVTGEIRIPSWHFNLQNMGISCSIQKSAKESEKWNIQIVENFHKIFFARKYKMLKAINKFLDNIE